MARAVHEKTISLDLNDLPQDKLQELDAYIDSLEDKKGSLIHVLHRAQNLFGYLPMEVQLYIARKLDVPGAKVFGVVSFYSYFTTEPRGKHTISVCMGTACFVKGSEDVLKKFMNELGIEKTVACQKTRCSQYEMSAVSEHVVSLQWLWWARRFMVMLRRMMSKL